MGKPYQSELEKLSETYSWAVSQKIEPFIKAIKASSHLPLIAVGSGGSYSAAEVMASCHREYFGELAYSVTPLELLLATPSNGQASIWFFSAGGGNIDIKRAFKHTLLLEPKQVAAVIGRSGSPLTSLYSKHHYADFFEFNLPAGRDGFLATNSLLAFSILICRGYNEFTKAHDDLPSTLDALLNVTLPKNLSLKKIDHLSQALWEKEALHVLFSNDLKAAALDIESKFIEAGLCSVHLADFRNFAHGRHHWLAKNGNKSAIIALSSPSEAELAIKTLNLIPSAIPRLNIPIQTNNASAKISSLVLSLFLAGYAGKAKGIDPGRPGVPSFGSKLYNLRTNTGFLDSISLKDAAIRRKVGTFSSLLSSSRRELWESSYNLFIKRLLKARFGGLVMDYDGTVVDSRNRFAPPTSDMVEQILRLLKNGIIIGFATGRGKSIRADLRKVIPEELWDQVLVGYYNGAEISSLSDDDVPDGSLSPCSALEKTYDQLKNNLEIMSLAKIEPRKFQLTVESNSKTPENFLWELAHDAICSKGDLSTAIFRSSHSIDIVAQGVSKISVTNEIIKKIGSEKDILAIGDRGKWPGNDTFLLKHVYSLSVDEVSPSHETCWNLCPAGIRGPQGTIYYLSNLQTVNKRSCKSIKFRSSGVLL